MTSATDQTTHSPAPWRVEERAYVYAIVDAEGQDLAYQDVRPQVDAGSVTSRGRSDGETRANARLIAAAPTLSEALQRIAGAERSDGAYDKHDAAGFIAIAKRALAGL